MASRVLAETAAGGIDRPDVGRHGARQRSDVGAKRRVERKVPGRVLADHVDDRAAAAPRVVEIGDRIRESRAEVREGHGRLAGHAAVAVRRTGAHPFEDARNRANRPLPCEGGHERDLGRAGIRETYLDARGSGGREKRVRSGEAWRCRHGKPLILFRLSSVIRERAAARCKCYQGQGTGSRQPGPP